MRYFISIAPLSDNPIDEVREIGRISSWFALLVVHPMPPTTEKRDWSDMLCLVSTINQAGRLDKMMLHEFKLEKASASLILDAERTL